MKTLTKLLTTLLMAVMFTACAEVGVNAPTEEETKTEQTETEKHWNEPTNGRHFCEVNPDHPDCVCETVVDCHWTWEE